MEEVRVRLVGRFGPEAEDSFAPHRRIDTAHADFAAGRDPVLDRALHAGT